MLTPRMPDAPPLLKRLQVVHHSSLAADCHEHLTLKFMPFKDVPFSPRVPGTERPSLPVENDMQAYMRKNST